jgi:hypothetical protein
MFFPVEEQGGLIEFGKQKKESLLETTYPPTSLPHGGLSGPRNCQMRKIEQRAQMRSAGDERSS